MRLDLALVERGLARSRNQAAAMIRDGKVSVDGRPVRKASFVVDAGNVIEAEAVPWVSRAAGKLIGALDDAGITVPARVLDAGASTGGFTQVCLDRGAQRVFAVDVGHDQLAEEVRCDPRVTVHEGLNLRDLTLEHVDGEPVDLVVGDVSFISLTMILEPMLAVCRGQALLLVKPQFEVGREKLGRDGIVVKEADRRAAIDTVAQKAVSIGWHVLWEGPSRVVGAHGNVEHFLHLGRR